MYWPHGGPERFRLKPIPLPEGNEGFAQRMRTVNLLTDVFWKLGVQNRFMLRRGNPLQLTVVGDGRPEEFVATQRFFGESSNLEIIEIDSSTHETARLMHEVLIEDISERTGIRFTP